MAPTNDGGDRDDIASIPITQSAKADDCAADHDRYPRGLAGQCVLVVQNDPIVALDCEDLAFDLGADRVLQASSMADAFDLVADHWIDLALIDLHGDTDFVSLIEDLEFKGAVMVLISSDPPAHQHLFERMQANGRHTVLEKPFLQTELLSAIARASGTGN